MTWHEQAACRDTPTEVFFPLESGWNAVRAWERARTICNTCPVRAECLDEALAIEGDDPHQMRGGMYGGMTPRERAIEADRRKRHPHTERSTA